MNNNRRKQVKEQTQFCKELMGRLDKLISDNVDVDTWWGGVHHHTQISNDIIRLRRELNALNKLMNPYD